MARTGYGQRPVRSAQASRRDARYVGSGKGLVGAADRVEEVLAGQAVEVVSSTAVTVAVRGTSRRRPISPKKSPGPSKRTCSPSRVTSTRPLTMTRNRSETSPSRTTAVPADAVSVVRPPASASILAGLSGEKIEMPRSRSVPSGGLSVASRRRHRGRKRSAGNPTRGARIARVHRRPRPSRRNGVAGRSERHRRDQRTLKAPNTRPRMRSGANRWTIVAKLTSTSGLPKPRRMTAANTVAGEG